MSNIEELEKLQRVDHDTNIRIESKVDGLINDIRDMRGRVNTKIHEHELRLRIIEDDHKSIGSVQDTFKRLVAVEEKVHDFTVSANVYRIIAGLLGGIIFYLFSQAPVWLRYFGINP